MAEISITITGLREFEAKLAQFPGKLRARKKRAMDKSVKHVQRKLSAYPPQEPTDYRRTGTLGRGWTTEVSADGNEGKVGNRVEYAPFVQGSRHLRPGQARVMQRKGWQNIDDVVKAEERQVVKFFEDEMGALARELN